MAKTNSTLSYRELAQRHGVEVPTPPQERVLDWHPRYDERSKAYGIREVIPRGAANLPVWRMWGMGPILDQGREGACVGFGWTAEALAFPVAPTPQPSIAVATRHALAMYKRAQQIDEWAGESYEGTSVLAGAKVMRERGYMNGYRWCFSATQVRDAVLGDGPVVMGVPWYEGMYSTRRSGLVEIKGPLVGGHCITITGYHPRLLLQGENPQYREVFRWRNSWGPYYGVYGNGYITMEDLKRLFSEGAEACVAMGRRNFKMI